MSHWNYRLVKTEICYSDGMEDHYAVHEVFYNDAGEPYGMTMKPVDFAGDTPEEVEKALVLALKDVRERGVFVPPEKWSER